MLHLAAEFLSERNLSIYWRRQKQCSILHRQNSTSNPKRVGSFKRLVEVSHSNNQNTHPPLPPQQIFLPPGFWVVTWQAATRVFLPTTKPAGSKESAWERVLWTPFSFYFLCRKILFSFSIPNRLVFGSYSWFRASVWYDHYGTEYLFTSRKCIHVFLI